MAQMEGRVVLITGAARGQGRSHAIRFAEEGADIIATDICADIPNVKYPMATLDDLEETAQLVGKLGRRCLTFVADSRDSTRMRGVVGQAVAELGPLDTVIINHGIHLPFGYDDPDADAYFNTVVETNLTAVWRVATAAIPHFSDQGGSILVTGSSASLIVVYNDAGYNSSKHGLVGLVKSLAADLSRKWIRVNLVCPTGVPTPLLLNETNLRKFVPDDPNATYEDMEFPLKTVNQLDTPWVEPRVVSDAMLYLAADTGKYITGISLPVDAGMSSQPPGITHLIGHRIWELNQAAKRHATE